MERTNATFNERVVRIVETCDGAPSREYYCIHDPDFGHWMSTEEFDEAIWTKDPHRRREFDNRFDALEELDRFLEWRREQEGSGGALAEGSEERDAA